LSRPPARGVTPRARPSAQEVAAKKKVIAWKYKRQRLRRDPDSINKTLMGRRRNETEDLIRYRFGALPDTDDRDIFLRLWCWSNPYSRDPAKDLREFGRRLGALLSDAEVKATIAYVQAHPRRFSAKTFGKHIRLTTAEWLRHRPTTMTPFDAKPKELERMRRDIRVERKRERRRREGAKPRAEYLAANTLSKTKPWETKGMSRAQWYRRRKSTAVKKATVRQVRDMHLTDLTGDTPVSHGKGKDPQAMKDQLPLRALPSCAEKATSSAPVPHSVSAAPPRPAFAGHHAEVVDAASVYGELPMELRLMALGLSSPVVTTERDADGADQLAA